jgi:putative colanic acid biosynthesis acetyltransferase WcaB
MSYLLQDWKVNSKNKKGQIILILFRLAQIASLNRFFFYFFIPYLLLYRILIEWILGIELTYTIKIGKNLRLYHGQSLVVNGHSIIGSNCTLRQSTTIGDKVNIDGSLSSCPIIGDNVDIGANVCIIGDVIIGNNVKIGAGSVVVKNIPDNCIVVGNPAKIIRYLS